MKHTNRTFAALLAGCAALALLGGCASSLSSPASPVVWVEGEDAATLPDGLAGRTLDKLPASGGKSLIGKAFAAKGNRITYNVELPTAMPEAIMTLRYSRLHVMRWTAAEATVTVTAGECRIVRQEIIDQTGGWGSREGNEWGLHAITLGDLPAGPIAIEIVIGKDNSDLNLDGFFLSPGPLTLTREDFGACRANSISSDGFVGLEITNPAIDQRDFANIKIHSKGFVGKRLLISADLLDAGGTRHRSIFKDRPLTLGPDGQVIEITPADLAGLADGQYTVDVHWADGAKSIDASLVAMGNLLGQAADKADRYEAFAETLDRYGPAVASRVKGDLVYAVEYIRYALVLLKSRDGRLDVDDSAHKKAMSYFEKAIARTAASFSDDLRGIIRQTDETIARITSGKDPYLNRSGDLRRAFYSDVSGMLEPYRVLIPEDYWASKGYKFLLALHGAGGDENYYPENDSGRFAEAAKRLGYLVAAPKANLRYRNGGEKDLKQLVELIQAEYPAIRADQTFCTGVSMGGGGTYRMALAYPELFRAVAIVSSGLRGEPDPEQFARLKSTPVLILHGKLDGVSPVETAYRMAEELKKRHFDYEMEIYPTYGHPYYGAEYLERTDRFFRKYPPID